MKTISKKLKTKLHLLLSSNLLQRIKQSFLFFFLGEKKKDNFEETQILCEQTKGFYLASARDLHYLAIYEL